MSPTLIRILFYYTTHFLNLTLIKCIFTSLLPKNNYLYSRFVVIYCSGWRLSVFQFQMRFRGLGLIWKINCSWKPGTAYSSTDQPGSPLQLQASFLGTAARGSGVRSGGEGSERGMDGGAWNAILFSELFLQSLEPVCRGNEHSSLPMNSE